MTVHRHAAIAVALLCAASCTPRWSTSARAADAALTFAAVAATACDWGQAHRQAADNYSRFRYEGNPLLGKYPSATEVDAYFIAAELGLVIAPRARPAPRWLPLAVGLAVAVAETVQAVRNTGVTPGFCGMTGHPETPRYHVEGWHL